MVIDFWYIIKKLDLILHLSIIIVQMLTTEKKY